MIDPELQLHPETAFNRKERAQFLPRISLGESETALVIKRATELLENTLDTTQLLTANGPDDIGEGEVEAVQRYNKKWFEEHIHPEIFNEGTRFHYVKTWLMGQVFVHLYNLRVREDERINPNVQAIIDLTHDEGRKATHLVLENDRLGDQILKDAKLPEWLLSLYPDHRVFWPDDGVRLLKRIHQEIQTEESIIDSRNRLYGTSRKETITGLIDLFKEKMPTWDHQFRDTSVFDHSPYWPINIIADYLGKEGATWAMATNIEWNADYASTLYTDKAQHELRPALHPYARLFTINLIPAAVDHVVKVGEWYENKTGISIEAVNNFVSKEIARRDGRFNNQAQNFEWESLNELLQQLISDLDSQDFSKKI